MAYDEQSPLQQLLVSLGARRARLEQMTEGPDEANAELVTEIAELTEQLLVADEELRTQHEELLHAQEATDSLLQSWESMFAGAQVPYLLTDVHGVLTNVNRAGRRLFGDTGVTRVRPIATKFSLADRRAIRVLIDESRTGTHTIRCTALRRDGTRVPVSVTATPMPATADTPASLWWQVCPISEPAAVATAEPAGDAHTASAPGGSEPDPVDGGALAGDPFADLELVGHVAAGLTARATVESLVRGLLVRALGALPQAGAAGVFLSQRKSGVSPAAALGELAELAADAHDETQTSPIRDAISGRVSVAIDDTRLEKGWPPFVQRVRAGGIGSMVVVPLVSDSRCIGALAFYAESPHALAADSQPVATACARHLEAVLSAQQAMQNLQQGMESREVIGQALGILMERHRISARQAFDDLVYASQTSHLKLREVARVLVTTGELSHT